MYILYATAPSIALSHVSNNKGSSRCVLGLPKKNLKNENFNLQNVPHLLHVSSYNPPKTLRFCLLETPY